MLTQPPPRHLIQKQREILPVKSVPQPHNNETEACPHQQKSQLKNVDGFDPYCFYKVPLGALGDTANTYI